MPTLKRVNRTNVDASPNQIVATADATRPIGLAEFKLYNPNAAEAYAHFYDATSGVVTVGTTTRTYGPVLLPAGAQVILRANGPTDPLQNFSTAITVAATTTISGNTSPTSDCNFEIHYWE